MNPTECCRHPSSTLNNSVGLVVDPESLKPDKEAHAGGNSKPSDSMKHESGLLVRKQVPAGSQIPQTDKKQAGLFGKIGAPDPKRLAKPEPLAKRPSQRVISSIGPAPPTKDSRLAVGSVKHVPGPAKCIPREGDEEWTVPRIISGLKVIIVPDTSQPAQNHAGTVQKTSDAQSRDPNYKSNSIKRSATQPDPNQADLRSSGVSFGGWMKVVPLGSDEEVPRETLATRPTKMELGGLPLQQRVTTKGKKKIAAHDRPKSSTNLPKTKLQDMSKTGTKNSASSKSLLKRNDHQQPNSDDGNPQKSHVSHRVLSASRHQRPPKNADKPVPEQAPPIVFYDDDDVEAGESQEILIQEVPIDSHPKPKHHRSSKRSNSGTRPTHTMLVPKTSKALNQSYSSERGVGSGVSLAKVGQISPRFGLPNAKEGEKTFFRSASTNPPQKSSESQRVIPASKQSKSGKLPNPAGILTSQVQQRIVCEEWVDSVPSANLPKSLKSTGKVVNSSSKLQSARAQREIDKLSKLSKPVKGGLLQATDGLGRQGPSKVVPDSPNRSNRSFNYRSLGPAPQTVRNHEGNLLIQNSQLPPKQTQEQSHLGVSRPSSVRQSNRGSPSRRNSDQKWFNSVSSPTRRSGSLRDFRSSLYSSRNRASEFAPIENWQGGNHQSELQRLKKGPSRDLARSPEVRRSSSRGNSRQRGLAIATAFAPPVNVINQSGVFKVIVKRTPKASHQPGTRQD